MTTHEALVKARNFIDAGWHQGSREIVKFGEIHNCATGAVTRAITGYSNIHFARDSERLNLYTNCLLKLYNELPTAYKIDHYDCDFRIALYNDEETTRKQDVLDLFDKAIAATAPEPMIGDLIPETGPYSWLSSFTS